MGSLEKKETLKEFDLRLGTAVKGKFPTVFRNHAEGLAQPVFPEGRKKTVLPVDTSQEEKDIWERDMAACAKCFFFSCQRNKEKRRKKKNNLSLKFPR